MSIENGEQERALDELMDLGFEIAGGIGGAAVGLAAAGATGAITGAVAGPALVFVLRRVASEVKARLLGPREEARIGATLVFAKEKIDEKINAGEEIRQDGFFNEQEEDRSTAEEVFESVLLAAQREPQENKLRFFGNLLANIAFHPGIDRAQANLFIRLSDDLSYRQVCLLALFGNKEQYRLRTEDYKSAEEEGLSLATVGVLQEVLELYSRGMLNASGSAVLGLLDICPARMNLQGTGAALYNFMELWGVPKQNVDEVVPLLE